MGQYHQHLKEVNYSLFGHELVVDNFAGAGGASIGMEDALQRGIDLAINHNPLALAVHKENHPSAQHAVADVWDIHPERATNGQPVGLCWFSPDCRHHSRAKGSRPVSKSVRGLAWVAVRWAATVKPRVICLENVTEIMEWGPLIKGPDGKTRPCPKRKGQTFRAFISSLKRHGYHVEWNVLRACDFGVPTIRERFFLIARRDGRPITWPIPTHGAPDSVAVKKGQLKPYPQGAQCIDWSIPTKSIFGRSKPLVDATLRRVASGVVRYVLQNPQPYIVKLNHTPDSGLSADDLAGAERVAQFLEEYAPAKSNAKTRAKGSATTAITHTVTDDIALDKQMAAFMINMKGKARSARDIREPITTICTGSTHAYLTVAFLAPYYGSGSGLTGRDLTAPMPTITCKDRLKLVTVTLDGQTYAIIDIGIRMLQPHELAKAQGFPIHYKFSGADGKPLAKNKQVHLIGNSVPPPVVKAIIQANFTHERFEKYERSRKASAAA